MLGGRLREARLYINEPRTTSPEEEKSTYIIDGSGDPNHETFLGMSADILWNNNTIWLSYASAQPLVNTLLSFP